MNFFVFQLISGIPIGSLILEKLYLIRLPERTGFNIIFITSYSINKNQQTKTSKAVLITLLSLLNKLYSVHDIVICTKTPY